MELLKDPKYLQRAVGLVKQAQSARAVDLVRQAQSSRDLLGIAGMKPKDLTAAVKTGISALVKGRGSDKTVRMGTKNKCDKNSCPRNSGVEVPIESLANVDLLPL